MKTRFTIDAWGVAEHGKWEAVVCSLVDAMPHLWPAGVGVPGCHLCRGCETFDILKDDREEFLHRRPGAICPEESCEGCFLACLQNY